MEQVKTLVLKKEAILALTQMVILVGVATFIPLLKQQALVGPTVNATLFISTVLLGPQNAILVGLIPRLVSISVGLLPPILAPTVPFIMVSNTLLILTFNYLREKNYWAGIVLASSLKYLFLFSTSSIVITLLLKKDVAPTVSAMLSWPQLATALAGGIIAYLALKAIKK